MRTKTFKNTIWITWQSHRRTQGICDKLLIELFELTTANKGIVRYFALSYRTLSTLMKRKPDTLIVQNPSIVLSALALVLKPFFNYNLVIDAHNEGVTPYVNKNIIFRLLTRTLHRFANVTVVTNDELKSVIIDHGGTPIVLPDPLPTPPAFENISNDLAENEFQITLVCTYAPDEPVQEILEAVRNLDNVQMFVTGDPTKARFNTMEYLDVEFTGFLSEEKYWRMLAESNLVIDLTSMPNCLVCGAYEALAVGTPLLLSEDISSQKLFNKGVRFTQNDRLNIKKAIEKIMSDYPMIRTEMKFFQSEYSDIWLSKADAFKEALNSSK